MDWGGDRTVGTGRKREFRSGSIDKTTVVKKNRHLHISDVWNKEKIFISLAAERKIFLYNCEAPIERIITCVRKLWLIDGSIGKLREIQKFLWDVELRTTWPSMYWCIKENPWRSIIKISLDEKSISFWKYFERLPKEDIHREIRRMTQVFFLIALLKRAVKACQ